MMQNNDEKNENENNKRWAFRGETILVVVSLFVNFAVMVNWFTALESRLTRIETTIEIKLDDRYFKQNTMKLAAHDSEIQ